MNYVPDATTAPFRTYEIVRFKNYSAPNPPIWFKAYVKDGVAPFRTTYFQERVAVVVARSHEEAMEIFRESEDGKELLARYVQADVAFL